MPSVKRQHGRRISDGYSIFFFKINLYAVDEATDINEKRQKSDIYNRRLSDGSEFFFLKKYFQIGYVPFQIFSNSH